MMRVTFVSDDLEDDVYDDIVKWCNTHIGNRVRVTHLTDYTWGSVTWVTQHGIGMIDFLFTNESDATLFKLTWL